jgi:exonuclease SbcD
MRVALISDSHFDASSRFDECVDLHTWIAGDIAQRGVDLVCLGGDLFERKSVPEERNAAAVVLRSLAESAPVVGVYGNHDAPGDLDIFGRLKTKHPIRFYSQPAVHTAFYKNGQKAGSVACLPWPRRASLLAAVGATSHENANQVAHELLQNVLRGLGAEMDDQPGQARVFLGHVQMYGSRVSTGQPLIGCDFEIGTGDLAVVRAHAYLLGHVHMGQSFDVEGAPCVYPGSPRRTAFGEVETKNYAIVDIDGGIARVELVPTPARAMLLVDGAFAPVRGHDPALMGDERYELVLADPGSVDGAEIRLRYTVAPERRDIARMAAQATRDAWLAQGAYAVKVEEEVTIATRARAPEVATAKTLAEKMHAHWASKGAVPDDATGLRLMTKLDELEEAV